MILFVMFPSQTVLDLARKSTNELVTSSINFNIILLLKRIWMPKCTLYLFLFEFLMKDHGVNKPKQIIAFQVFSLAKSTK